MLEPWYSILNPNQTLKGLGGWRTLSGFNDYFNVSDPRVVAALQPWAEISERLRRIRQFRRRIYQFHSAYSLISIGVFIQTDALLQSALRSQKFAQAAGICGGGCGHARARNRRQHGYLQRRERRIAAAASVCTCR